MLNSIVVYENQYEIFRSQLLEVYMINKALKSKFPRILHHSHFKV